MKVGGLVRHKGCLGIVTYQTIPPHGWYNGVRTENYVEWVTKCNLRTKNWSDGELLEVVSK